MALGMSMGSSLIIAFSFIAARLCISLLIGYADGSETAEEYNPIFNSPASYHILAAAPLILKYLYYLLIPTIIAR
jgi:hypothetical protein